MESVATYPLTQVMFVAPLTTAQESRSATSLQSTALESMTL
jgi:hypothetical protein